MTRPLPILVALAVSSPALYAVVRGGLGVDTALLRLLIALVVCGVVDSLVRAWWPDPPAPAVDLGDDLGASGGIPVAATPGAPRLARAGETEGAIHARRRTDVPAP